MVKNEGRCPAIDILPRLSPSQFASIASFVKREIMLQDESTKIIVFLNISLSIDPFLIGFPVQPNVAANNTAGLATIAGFEAIIIPE